MTLTSCNLFKGSGIELEIENNSDHPITDVKFTTTEKLSVIEFKKIENNKSVSEFLKMDKNRSDGSYYLEFKRSNGQNESKEYGYYTNGGPLDNKIIFQVENDTISARTSEY
jgi:hypothetical protein